MCTHTHTHVDTCPHVYTCLHLYGHVDTRSHVTERQNVSTRVYTHIDTCLHVSPRVYIHVATHRHVSKSVCIHPHIHMCCVYTEREGKRERARLSHTHIQPTSPIPSTTPQPTNTSNMTNASNVTAVEPPRREIMDPAVVETLAESVTTVVASVVALAAVTSLAGAASGPGALAVIGQVQVLSQIGKVGGGGGALQQFSESFGWANAELPFQLVPTGIPPPANGEPAEPTEQMPTSIIRPAPTTSTDTTPPRTSTATPAPTRTWSTTPVPTTSLRATTVPATSRAERRASSSGTARWSSRRKDQPQVGETHEQQDPKCKKPDLSEEEEKECRKCGIINGVSLLDKIIVVLGSLVMVFALRCFAQYLNTRCLKRDPMDSLKFPGWEGPLLLAHWFGMCESITRTIGRPCPVWYVLSAVVLFVGPICFMVFAMLTIRRHMANGDIHFEMHPEFTWAQALAEMRTTVGCFGKLKVFKKWWDYKRHKGEWKEETEPSKFWAFILKDLHGKSWVYFVWILVKKLLLAAAMSLTMESSNAVIVVVLQVIELMVVIFTWPNADNLSNLQESFGAVSNLLAIVCSALPSFMGEMPSFLGDVVLLCIALAGTAVAAVTAIVGPVVAIVGQIQSLFGALLSVAPVQEGAMAGALGAGTATVFESVAAIVEDGVAEVGEEMTGHGDDGVGAGTAVAVGVGVGVAVAASSSRSKGAKNHWEIRQDSVNNKNSEAVKKASENGAGYAGSKGKEKQEKHDTEPLSKKKKVACESNPEFPPVLITLKLLLDFERVGAVPDCLFDCLTVCLTVCLTLVAF